MTAPTQTTGPHHKPELTLPAVRSLGELADLSPVLVTLYGARTTREG